MRGTRRPKFTSADGGWYVPFAVVAQRPAAAESLRSNRLKRMHSSKLMIWLFTALLLAGCGDTDYANKTAGRNWHLVAVGDSIDDLYHKVGAPLFTDVNPDRAGLGAYRTIRDANVQAAHLQGLCADTNVALCLRYSWPAPGSPGHYRYEVDVVAGVVIRKTQGEWVD